jgi:hypothetical protein
MNQRLALHVLDKVMQWDTERATKEFAWLRLMSDFKYDSYRDYVAGARFIECLADWLQQFEQSERETAYKFLRENLVFVGAAEMQHLVERTFPQVIHGCLVTAAASALGIPPYGIWSDPRGAKAYDDVKRKTLFLGLSDGARIDVFRRSNAGRISNEQVVLATQINNAKWDSLLSKLRADLSDPNARFMFAFLLDDFIGTGTTLLREEEGVWDGKLNRFWEDIREVLPTHFQTDWRLFIHHYLATHAASHAVKDRHILALKSKGESNWFRSVEFTFGMVLPKEFPIDKSRHAGFLQLVEKYYDPSIQTKHTDLGGTDVRRGFGSCGLPLILEHNTPNNSIALLWAETIGGNGIPAMRPLFRRRQRHS